MIVYHDANVLYDAASKAMTGSKFKHSTQLYRINQLLETAKLQEELVTEDYEPTEGKHFVIKERGHTRKITSNTMADKTVNHVICDEVLTPATSKYLIYDNSASQKNKGVAFHRKRFEVMLHRYYNRTGSNDGYILLADFKGYYDSIPHGPCLEQLKELMLRSGVDPATAAITLRIMRAQLALRPTGAGADIGSQPSQNIGIVYPYRYDNFAKIVRGVKEYARYTDDSYAIGRTREELEALRSELTAVAAELGLVVHPRKTRIVKLSSTFKHLQVKYSCAETGRVHRRISSKNTTRERRKIKAYKHLVDEGRMTYDEVENAFKSWLGTHWRYMSHTQIYNLSSLYLELFGRRPKWKKGHSRLHWLMAHPSTISSRTGTTSSPGRRSARRPSTEGSIMS